MNGGGTKRKRSRTACRPCKDRKRKCDGESPCVTCTEWGYDCFYDASAPKNDARKASVRVAKAFVESNLSPQSEHERSRASPKPSPGELVGRLEANSSAAFVRNLALKIDPTKAPKLSLFGWNIGLRQDKTTEYVPHPMRIHEIASLEQFQTLATAYFDKLDPTYGFIDRADFFQRLVIRLQSPWTAPDKFDSVVAGVAALGSLFSNRTAPKTEFHLVETCRSILEARYLKRPPCVDIITGWTLRAIYLRFTGTPYETWMTSSTLMHLLEAAGLHTETHSVLHTNAEQSDLDIKKRLVGMAQHLNIWVSYDLGLTRVSFNEEVTPSLPMSRPGNCTPEIISLLPLAIALDPSHSKDNMDLTSALSELLKRIHTASGFILAKSNLVLCILRRIYSQNSIIASELIEPTLALFKSALQRAAQQVEACAPWHQVANIPFQILYMLLVINTRASLELLPEAMRTLQYVVSEYNTESMREAYNVAGLLLLLHQQRKKDDISVLDKALSTYREGTHLETEARPVEEAEDFSWIGTLVADMPGIQGLDLDQLFAGDMGQDDFQ